MRQVVLALALANVRPNAVQHRPATSAKYDQRPISEIYPYSRVLLPAKVPFVAENVDQDDDLRGKDLQNTSLKLIEKSTVGRTLFNKRRIIRSICECMK